VEVSKYVCIHWNGLLVYAVLLLHTLLFEVT
jgi:hypothetical protein